MIEKAKRETILNLPLGFRLPELTRAAQPEKEECCETLWDRVIRMCDQCALKPREHCHA